MAKDKSHLLYTLSTLSSLYMDKYESILKRICRTIHFDWAKASLNQAFVFPGKESHCLYFTNNMCTYLLPYRNHIHNLLSTKDAYYFYLCLCITSILESINCNYMILFVSVTNKLLHNWSKNKFLSFSHSNIFQHYFRISRSLEMTHLVTSILHE